MLKIIFQVYLTLLVAVVFFPIPIAVGENIVHRGPGVHLIPWESTIDLYKHSGMDDVITNVGGNLILLTPFLVFICYYVKNLRLDQVIFISFAISLFIEGNQVVLSYVIPNLSRQFDTMDLICNTISGVIGYFLYKLDVKINYLKKEESKEENKRCI